MVTLRWLFLLCIRYTITISYPCPFVYIHTAIKKRCHLNRLPLRPAPYTGMDRCLFQSGSHPATASIQGSHSSISIPCSAAIYQYTDYWKSAIIRRYRRKRDAAINIPCLIHRTNIHLVVSVHHQLLDHLSIRYHHWSNTDAQLLL